MDSTEIKEADRIYFRDVEPKLRESQLQPRYDELRKKGFTFGVNVENPLEHTDYKKKQLNRIMEMSLDENTSPAFIGRKYRELYKKGKDPAKK